MLNAGASHAADDLPLTGVRVVEYAGGVAAAYAGRLLAAMGADIVMVEPTEEGSALRREPPFLADGSEVSAVFAYLCAGKRSVALDLETGAGGSAFDALLAQADILLNDTPLDARAAIRLGQDQIAERHPDIVHVSVLPFGADGPKATWRGTELNLVHAGGEGYLLPNGLAAERFPDRPPLKIAGSFAEMQGGVAAALGALSALWFGSGQFVDISIQDANVAVGAFTVQRLGDGSLEHRASRSFRYGGVIECRDGSVELLTLEDRQWKGLVELMGAPDWARDATLDDAVERSKRGAMINEKIRAWARDFKVDDLVAKAQAMGVPMAPYNTPERILQGEHETARGGFPTIDIPGIGPCPMQTAPFRFEENPMPAPAPPPILGAHQDSPWTGWSEPLQEKRSREA